MDETAQAAHIALHQRFDALKANIQEIHTLWQQAVVARDIPRQKALISQERALLAEVHRVLEAFRDSLARLHGEEAGHGAH